MPLIHLAKLADLKADGGWSGNQTDTQLLRYLAAASSIAERAAGLNDSGLRRAIDRIEFPVTDRVLSPYLRLNARVLESVSEVIQLHSTGTDADFTTASAAGASGGVLTQNVDYTIASAFLATLQRVYGTWYRQAPRSLRVTYTAGLADPARINVTLATATWTEATKTLTQVGAFANYAFAAGDKIAIESGTGVTKGTYLIASRTDDDAVVLDESLSTSGVDLATGDITSLAPGAAGVTDPPDELQAAVIQQAMLLHNTADTAGLEKIDFGDAGGSVSMRGMKTHPALTAAVQRYRRLL